MSQSSPVPIRKVGKTAGSYYYDHNMIGHIFLLDWEEFNVSKESEDHKQHGCNICEVFKHESAGGIYRGTG